MSLRSKYLLRHREKRKRKSIYFRFGGPFAATGQRTHKATAFVSEREAKRTFPFTSRGERWKSDSIRKTLCSWRHFSEEGGRERESRVKWKCQLARWVCVKCPSDDANWLTDSLGGWMLMWIERAREEERRGEEKKRGEDGLTLDEVRCTLVAPVFELRKKLVRINDEQMTVYSPIRVKSDGGGLRVETFYMLAHISKATPPVQADLNGNCVPASLLNPSSPSSSLLHHLLHSPEWCTFFQTHSLS